ncbi:MAG: hypothetical protein WB809_01825 [Thermoplasmata archaeon]
MGDRPHLVEDLDLLGVGPDQVQDLVVGGRRVLEQRREGRDRLPAPGRGVDEKGAPPGREVADGVEDQVLARSDAVREQRGGPGGCSARRSLDSAPTTPRSGF